MIAKRGDSVAVVREVTDYYINPPRTETRTTVELGRVVSVTREGVVKAAERFNGGALPLNGRVVVIPAGVVAPSDVARQAELHRWPSGPGYVPFESLDELRETLRPFRITEGATA